MGHQLKSIKGASIDSINYTSIDINKSFVGMNE